MLAVVRIQPRRPLAYLGLLFRAQHYDPLRNVVCGVVAMMSEQLGFWDRDEATIQARFEEFHRLNPAVYDELVKLARRAKRRGHKRMGIELLFAIVRWRRMMRTSDPSSSFKLNDHYTSRYARLIMEQEPDLEQFFELRRLRAL